jgi:hypothetical protein
MTLTRPVPMVTERQFVVFARKNDLKSGGNRCQRRWETVITVYQSLGRINLATALDYPILCMMGRRPAYCQYILM